MNFLVISAVVFVLVNKLIGSLKKKADAPAPAEPKIKECPHCLMEVPIKATRCGHCTSELAA